MKKKKILFHYPILNMGGAEVTLINLTEKLLQLNWKVEVVCDLPGGVLESSFNPKVKISYLQGKAAGHKFFNAKSTKDRLLSSHDLFQFLFRRIEYRLRSIKYRFKKYDVAAIYLQGLSPRFCCEVVKARKKIHWIHSDLANCDKSNRQKRNIERYHHLTDRYVCVSKTAMDSLISEFPFLLKKTSVIYNLINSDDILRKMSVKLDKMEMNKTGIQIISVCRLLDRVKGISRMVEAHARLKELGFCFHWFVIGDGPDRAKIQSLINDKGLTNNFILLGSKDNPYPYYKKASLVAMLSFYEGLSGIINEAKVCGKAVIATEVSGVSEQICHKENGIIVQNNIDSIVNGLAELLENEQLLKRINNNYISDFIQDDEIKIREIIKLFDN